MTFIDILKEELIGKDIMLEHLGLIEIEDDKGIRPMKREDFACVHALITDVYDVYSGDEFHIGVKAKMPYWDEKDLDILFTLSPETEIVYLEKREKRKRK